MLRFALWCLAVPFMVIAASQCSMADPIVFDWTGAFFGAHLGYGRAKSKELSYEQFRGPDVFLESHLDPRGMLGGVYAGYNFQLASGVVVGAEADASLSGLRNQSLLYVYGGMNYLSTDDLNTSSVRWMASARARLGYSFDRFLPYVTGGVAVADFRNIGDHKYHNYQFDSTAVGYTVGAGLEYAITDHLVVRADYRFSDFGDIGQITTRTIAANGFEQHQDYDLSVQDVRLGIAFKF